MDDNYDNHISYPSSSHSATHSEVISGSRSPTPMENDFHPQTRQPKPGTAYSDQQLRPAPGTSAETGQEPFRYCRSQSYRASDRLRQGSRNASFHSKSRDPSPSSSLSSPPVYQRFEGHESTSSDYQNHLLQHKSLPQSEPENDAYDGLWVDQDKYGHPHRPDPAHTASLPLNSYANRSNDQCGQPLASGRDYHLANQQSDTRYTMSIETSSSSSRPPYRHAQSSQQSTTSQASSAPPSRASTPSLARHDSETVSSSLDLTTYKASGEGADAQADLRDDGRIDVTLNIKKSLPPVPLDYAVDDDELPTTELYTRPPPSLNIVIFITGSRGDVQPYLSLAIQLVLCESKHRVRICTHGDFKEFVLKTGRRILLTRLRGSRRGSKSGLGSGRSKGPLNSGSGFRQRKDEESGGWQSGRYTESPNQEKPDQFEKLYLEDDSKLIEHDRFEKTKQAAQSKPSQPTSSSDPTEEEKEIMGRLEFFDVGGSPKELMAYMVKNPGLLPGIESIRKGEIGKKQHMVKEMLHNFLVSTYMPDSETGRAFAADAILSNPPSFAHTHIAEMSGLPMIGTFTMPWSPTIDFNHPLVNIKQSNAEKNLTNYLTYALAEHMTWQGLRGVINDFRQNDLHLDRLDSTEGPGLADRLKIPHIYCWSPAVVPKPNDWKSHIEISGYFWLGDTDYTPDPKLAEFLATGPPPVYIGFGSIVVDDPDKLTRTIFETVAATGVRALVSAGWSDIGAQDIPENVFILGNVPHDWLFADGRVAAVCHHGGAGTTAIGLKNGVPTIVVPFFGDQPFQGAMVARAGAGPEPIPYSKLTTETLTEAINSALSPEIRHAATKFGEAIRDEDGESTAIAFFHKNLPISNMICDLDETRVAIWRHKQLCLRLSGLAACVLVDAGKIAWDELRPHRAREYDPKRIALFPLAGGVTKMLSTITSGLVTGAELFYKPVGSVSTLMTAPILGLVNTVVGFYDSLEALPKFWGSEIRMRKPEGVLDGFIEGGKGLAYGFGDGYGGLIYKPYFGARDGGWAGAGKGLAHGVLDALFKPASGALALVAQPARGIANSLQKARRKRNNPYIKPRVDVSMDAFNKSKLAERERIVVAFNRAMTTTAQRKEAYKRAKEQNEAKATMMIKRIGSDLRPRPVTQEEVPARR